MPLSAFPRTPLAHLPTPIEPLPRLTAALGGPEIFVKRDDCTGLAFGGNKTRKLEFALGHALAQGADTVITAGGLQSNHCRQTAAACAKLGLACELVLNRAVPDREPAYEVSGNLLLDRLLGARLHLQPPGPFDREAGMAELAEKLKDEGRKPYVVPAGASYAMGALGFAACALEIQEQAADMGLAFDAVLHASGSGGTQAGLIAGMLLAEAETAVIGIDIDDDWDALHAKVSEVAADTLDMLGQEKAPLEAALDLRQGYGSPGYGLPNEAMVRAVTLLAREEGLLLDPVYTGKAMAGLIDLVEQGQFGRGQRVVFLHTGGAPGLFAYPSLFQKEMP
ncbi:MAG: D-cysteine desulfhydrase [Pseudomonadota bacterium]